MGTQLIETDPLKLSGKVVVAPTTQQLLAKLGQALMQASAHAALAHGAAHWAFSGGSTPRAFYERLATGDEYQAIPWNKVHLWIVDERRVPEDDDKSNFKMIQNALGSRLSVNRDGTKPGIHPMPVLDPDPAGQYERALHAASGLEWTQSPKNNISVPRLDFVLLGMGGDAHTASLFPHSQAIPVRDRLITTNGGPTVVPPPRVTMTYPLINAGRQVAILITGKDKATTLRRVDAQLRTGSPNPAEFPITAIAPTDGQLTWYLDPPAAGQSS